MAIFVSVLYAVVPFIVMGLRPGYRRVFQEMGMDDKLPLPTKIMLYTPLPVFFMFALAIIVLLQRAAWKGPRRVSTNLNLAGMVGMGLFIGAWWLSMIVPVIKIQGALEGR